MMTSKLLQWTCSRYTAARTLGAPDNIVTEAQWTDRYVSSDLFITRLSLQRYWWGSKSQEVGVEGMHGVGGGGLYIYNLMLNCPLQNDAVFR